MEHPQGLWPLIAFSAGLLSFISPCVLPLIPSYLSYITGVSLGEIKDKDRSYIRRITFAHSLFFILGFSIIFVLLGASATLIGRSLAEYQPIIRRVGGIIIVVFGLHLTGVFKIKFLFREKRLHLKRKPMGLAGSALVGVTFAAGWTPCLSPILSTILLAASVQATVGRGVLLLAAYSAGFAIPFLFTSLVVNSFLVYFGRLKRYLGAVSFLSGLFLIAVGILLFINYFQILSEYLTIRLGHLT